MLRDEWRVSFYRRGGELADPLVRERDRIVAELDLEGQEQTEDDSAEDNPGATPREVVNLVPHCVDRASACEGV